MDDAEAQVIPVSQVKPGDQVVGPEGDWIDVVEVYDNGVQDVYEVMFEGGEAVECTITHQFPTREYGDLPVGLVHSLRASVLVKGSYSKTIALEKIGPHPTYDLQVDHPSHTYHLANGVLTHNSHSVSYMLTAFRQLYMLTHHTPYYFAALLSEVKRDKKVGKGDDATRLGAHIRAASADGIKVHSPCILEGDVDFTVTKDGNIRYGIGKIKGVGKSGPKIMKVASETGPTYLHEFYEACKGNRITQTHFRSLIYAGALDRLEIDPDKSTFMVEYPWAGGVLDHRNALFNNFLDLSRSKKEHQYLTNQEILNEERELLGTTLSFWCHPGDVANRVRSELGLLTIKEAIEKDKANLHLLVEISKLKKHKTKKGTTMAFVEVSDETGTLGNITLWPNEMKQFSAALKPGAFVVICFTRKKAYDKKYGKWSYNLRKDPPFGPVVMLDQAMKKTGVEF